MTDVQIGGEISCISPSITGVMQHTCSDKCCDSKMTNKQVTAETGSISPYVTCLMEYTCSDNCHGSKMTGIQVADETGYFFTLHYMSSTIHILCSNRWHSIWAFHLRMVIEKTSWLFVRLRYDLQGKLAGQSCRAFAQGRDAEYGRQSCRVMEIKYNDVFMSTMVCRASRVAEL